jgi:predicted nucleic acid-binding protein
MSEHVPPETNEIMKHPRASIPGVFFFTKDPLKLGIDAGQRFLNQLVMQVEYGFVKALPVNWEHIVQARKIIMKYKDQPLTLTDASSVILMSQSNILRIASYDNHFRILGLCVLP